MSVPPAVAVLTLTEVRARAAAALAPIADDDPEVFVDVVDAVTPPALMLVWEDPWIEPQTYGRSLYFANLSALCIAGRLEPGPGVEKLEQLVGYVIERLGADAYAWPHATSTAPQLFEIGGASYLGARVTYRVPVQIGD